MTKGKVGVVGFACVEENGKLADWWPIGELSHLLKGPSCEHLTDHRKHEHECLVTTKSVAGRIHDLFDGKWKIDSSKDAVFAEKIYSLAKLYEEAQ